MIPLVYAGDDEFINLGPGTADATNTDAHFPAPIAFTFAAIYLSLTTATLPAGPYTINLMKNNVSLGAIAIISNGSTLVIGGFPVSFVPGDRIQLKGVPTGGGGTGLLALGGSLYCTP